MDDRAPPLTRIPRDSPDAPPGLLSALKKLGKSRTMYRLSILFILKSPCTPAQPSQSHHVSTSKRQDLWKRVRDGPCPRVRRVRDRGAHGEGNPRIGRQSAVSAMWLLCLLLMSR
jgi:hypothetical protein